MSEHNDSDASKKRPFLGIFFRCCKVYWRIYKNKDGSAYEGRCPKCMAKVKVNIGNEGSSERFFIAQ